jgi:hypothetical protein
MGRSSSGGGSPPPAASRRSCPRARFGTAPPRSGLGLGSGGLRCGGGLRTPSVARRRYRSRLGRAGLRKAGARRAAPRAGRLQGQLLLVRRQDEHPTIPPSRAFPLPVQGRYRQMLTRAPGSAPAGGDAARARRALGRASQEPAAKEASDRFLPEPASGADSRDAPSHPITGDRPCPPRRSLRSVVGRRGRGRGVSAARCGRRRAGGRRGARPLGLRPAPRRGRRRRRRSE